MVGNAHRRLTLRSSGAPTAGHQARAGGTPYIFTGPGLASCRRRPLSSNVRPRKNQPRRIATRLDQVVSPQPIHLYSQGAFGMLRFEAHFMSVLRLGCTPSPNFNFTVLSSSHCQIQSSCSQAPPPRTSRLAATAVALSTRALGVRRWHRAARPNHSLKWSANGLPLGLGYGCAHISTAQAWWQAVVAHLAQTLGHTGSLSSTSSGHVFHRACRRTLRAGPRGPNAPSRRPDGT